MATKTDPNKGKKGVKTPRRTRKPKVTGNKAIETKPIEAEVTEAENPETIETETIETIETEVTETEAENPVTGEVVLKDVEVEVTETGEVVLKDVEVTETGEPGPANDENTGVENVDLEIQDGNDLDEDDATDKESAEDVQVSASLTRALVLTYMHGVKKGREVSASEGAAHQRRLYTIIHTAVENENPEEFRKQWTELRSLFDEYHDRELGPDYVNRFAQAWTGGHKSLESYHRVINVLLLTRNAELMNINSKFIDFGRSFSPSETEFTSTALTNMLNYYNAG